MSTFTRMTQQLFMACKLGYGTFVKLRSLILTAGSLAKKAPIEENSKVLTAHSASTSHVTPAADR